MTATQASVRVLIVEDSADDAELIDRALKAGGLAVASRRAASESEMHAALADFKPDAILTDWNLDGFSGAAALAIAHAWDADVPCVLVSGALGGDLVVEAIRTGATDYVPKGHLEALAPALRRALAEGAARRNQHRLAAEVDTLRDAMASSLDAMDDPFVMCVAVRAADGAIVDYTILFVNRPVVELVGVPAPGLIGHTIRELLAGPFGEEFLGACTAVVETGRSFRADGYRVPDLNGVITLDSSVVNLTITKLGDGFFVNWRDVTEGSRTAAERDFQVEVLRNVRESVIAMDTGGAITYWSDGAAALFGYTSAEMLGQKLEAIYPPNSGLTSSDIERLDGGADFNASGEGRRKDGSAVWIQIHTSILRGPDKVPHGYLSIATDMSAHHAQEWKLARQGAAIEHADEMVVITDVAGAIEYVNPAFERVTGYLSEEVIGQNPRLLNSGRQPKSFYTVMWAGLTAGRPHIADFVNRKKDGSEYDISAVISPIRDAEGVTTGYVSVARDMTKQRRQEDIAGRVARERAAISRAIRDLDGRQSPEIIALGICREIAGLEGVGYAALFIFESSGGAVPYAVVLESGDTYPSRSLPTRRSRYLRDQAVRGPWVERWSAVSGQPYDQLLSELGVRANAYAPVRDGDHVVGVLVIGSTTDAAEELLASALPALVEFAALCGSILGPGVAARAAGQDAQRAMASIVRDTAFSPVYQPIVDVIARRVIGYEALTRFDDGVPPDVRFQEAAALGLSTSLELATIRAAIAGARHLPTEPWLSINVSPTLVLDNGVLFDIVHDCPRELVLELTEHAAIADYDPLLRAVTKFKEKVRIAVDDAGAGFSSLHHIVKLRPTYVKLDITIVRDIDRDPIKQALVAGMRHFARNAGFALIAEGVETEGELAMLRSMDISYVQGYLLGRPMPAHQLAAATPAPRPQVKRRTGASSKLDGSPEAVRPALL